MLKQQSCQQNEYYNSQAGAIKLEKIETLFSGLILITLISFSISFSSQLNVTIHYLLTSTIQQDKR